MMRTIVITAALALLASCGEDEPEVRLSGDERVLATVAGTEITAWDLEQGIARTLSADAASQLDARARRAILESLVSSRAIALAREGELTPEQKESLEREVAVYREQLLVRQYLAAHGQTESISDARIREYYESHRASFGGAAVRTYEMLFTTRSVTDAERAALLARLAAAQGADLRVLATELAAAGLPVAHRAGESPGSALHERLVQALSALSPNQTSPVTFIDERAFVLRNTGEQRRPPRPLAEVSAEIRQILAPTQLRDSIEAVQRRVLSRTSVEYR